MNYILQMNRVVVVFFLFSLSTYFPQLSIDKRVVAEDKYHEAKKIILREGAAFPAILCDALLIGKNRAERIFDQLKRDGIVSPKDENGNRKIIKS